MRAVIESREIDIKHKQIWDYKWTIINVYKFITKDESISQSYFTKMIKSITPTTQLIWRVHMLNPKSYYKDCIDTFGFIIPFVIDPKQLEYINSNQKFIDQVNKSVKSGIYGKKIFSPSIDLEMAVDRQLEFIKKMNKLFADGSNNWNNINERLNASLLRYCAFLLLFKIQKEKDKQHKHFLVPRLDIDLMWHSHQLNPVLYHEMSLKLFDIDVFNHNDNIEEGVLNDDRISSEKIWNTTFKNYIADTMIQDINKMRLFMIVIIRSKTALLRQTL